MNEEKVWKRREGNLSILSEQEVEKNPVLSRANHIFPPPDS